MLVHSMFPNFQTIQAPLFAAILFLVISAPTTYSVTNDYLTQPLFQLHTQHNGVPSRFGLLLHSIVYFALVYTFLKNK